ncbi:MAG: CrcB family protein, partial [Alistipes sp.]|nr:CrcB family protein [Alistipes sp.]
RFLSVNLFHFVFINYDFSWVMFSVKVVGSFLIGLLFGLAEKNNVISPSMNVLLITGFCGGFTTFSSLADDMFLLLQQKNWLTFGLYAGLTFVLGILLVWAGRAIVKG